MKMMKNALILLAGFVATQGVTEAQIYADYQATGCFIAGIDENGNTDFFNGGNADLLAIEIKALPLLHTVTMTCCSFDVPNRSGRFILKSGEGCNVYIPSTDGVAFTTDTTLLVYPPIPWFNPDDHAFAILSCTVDLLDMQDDEGLLTEN